jgi:hypothetical protein
MTERMASKTKVPSSWGPRGGVLLQRKCACGKHGANEQTCAECSAKKVQRAFRSKGSIPSISPTVQQVVDSPGSPLDSSTRVQMEQHFGQDFSGVRIHTDAQAAQSADAVDALAYTMGSNIVFGRGQYAPSTPEGRKLVAHELTHVVQQSGHGAGTTDHGAAEAEAESVAANLPSRRSDVVRGSVAGYPLLRQPKSKPGVDATAQAIIDAAKDATATPDAGKRATELVWSILRTYYPDQVAKVREVVYDAVDPGLTTEPILSAKDLGKKCSDKGGGKGDPASTATIPSGANLQVKMCVGDSFLNQVEGFARRVLQVGHELQHADQQRAGLGGPKNKNKREFQAYAWEALQDAKPGTGKMPNATRVDLIDCALAILLCMSSDEQQANAATKAELLKKREAFNGKSGNAPTEPPASCGEHPKGCSGDFTPTSAPSKP